MIGSSKAAAVQPKGNQQSTEDEVDIPVLLQELLTALEDGTPPKPQHSHAAHVGTVPAGLAAHPAQITCPAQGQKPRRLSTDYSQLLTLPAQEAAGAISRDCSANGASSDVQRRQGHSDLLHATPLAVRDSPGSSSRPCGQLQTNLAASWQTYFSQKASMAPINSAGRQSPGAAVPGILHSAQNLSSAQSGSSKAQHQSNPCPNLSSGLQPGHLAEPLPQHQHHTGSSSPCRALPKWLLLLAVILLHLLAAGIFLPASLQMQQLGSRCSMNSSGEMPSAAASGHMPAADCQVPTWLLHVMRAAQSLQGVGGSLPAGLWCRMQRAARMHHVTGHTPLDSPDAQAQTDPMTGHQPAAETAPHPGTAVGNQSPLDEPLSQHKAQQSLLRQLDLQQQSAEQQPFPSFLHHPGELEAQASQLLLTPKPMQQQQQQPEPMQQQQQQQQQQQPEPMPPQQQQPESMQRQEPCGPNSLQDCPLDPPQQPAVTEQQAFSEVHPAELAFLSCSQLADLHPQLTSTPLGVLLQQYHALSKSCGERASEAAGDGVVGQATMLHAGAVGSASSAGLLGLILAEDAEAEQGQHATEDTLSGCFDSMAAVPASAAALALHAPVQTLPDGCNEGIIPRAQMVGGPSQQATNGSYSKSPPAAADPLHGRVTKLYSAAALQVLPALAVAHDSAGMRSTRPDWACPASSEEQCATELEEQSTGLKQYDLRTGPSAILRPADATMPSIISNGSRASSWVFHTELLGICVMNGRVLLDSTRLAATAGDVGVKVEALESTASTGPLSPLRSLVTERDTTPLQSAASTEVVWLIGAACVAVSTLAVLALLPQLLICWQHRACAAHPLRLQ